MPLPFTGITSTFAETDPHVGDTKTLMTCGSDREASPGSNEVMIWTENSNETPGGNGLSGPLALWWRSLYRMGIK